MKKFLVGVGNVFAYNKKTGDLLFQSRTMLDTAIEVTTDSTNINGGQGNSLQYVYFHTGQMNITLTETQFNLAMLASNVGSNIVTGGDIWTEETVALGVGGAGTVSKTPLVQPDITGSTVYGWVTDANGDTTKVTFTGSDFTLAGGQSGDEVCVRYYANDTAAKVVTINSNIIPANVRLVMEAQLASSESSDISGASIIGKVQFEINSAQLSGSQSFELSSSGVSQTPLSAMALADNNGIGGCSGNGVYARVIEVLNDANWYDDVFALAIADDTIELATSATTTPSVYALPNQGVAFKPPYGDLTFASSDAAVATVDSAGLVTGVGAGTATITVTITGKTSVDTTATVTVS